MVRFEYQKNIPAGETVGDETGKVTAPSEQGTYTLYELANEHNSHIGWEWVNEQSGAVYRTASLW